MSTLSKSHQGDGQGRRGATQFALSAFLFLCPLASPAIIANAQDAQTLLSQAKSAEKTLQYSATQTISRGSETEVARLYRSGMKRRVEWVSPASKRGDVWVDDGENVYVYYPAEKTVTQSNSHTRSPLYVAAGAAKKTNFAGRSAFSIPVSGGRTVVLDAATKAVLSVKGGNGSFALSKVQFGNVPAQKFVFTKPAGVELTKFDGVFYANLAAAKRACDWMKTPGSVPSGWKFDSALVSAKTAWLRYFNGKSRFSIFQEPSDGGDVQVQPTNGGYFWKSGGTRVFVTGVDKNVAQQLSRDLK